MDCDAIPTNAPMGHTVLMEERQPLERGHDTSNLLLLLSTYLKQLVNKVHSITDYLECRTIDMP